MELARQIIAEPISFEAGDASTSARLFNLPGRRRGSLGDCMIAAVALRADAVVATGNPEDFRRFEPAGVRVVARRRVSAP